MKKSFYNAVSDRRTYYGIGKESVVSDERIKEVVEHAVKHTPSAFNSQSARVVILLNEQHDKLWDITKEALKKIVTTDKFSSTEEKINSFRNGYGTILFFEDNSIVKSLQEQYTLYKDNFPIWSQQASGMHQYVIWTALEVEGFGVSLQHYNEVIESDVKDQWKIPNNWKLIAQMPFGKPISSPEEKEYRPLNQRVKLFK